MSGNDERISFMNFREISCLKSERFIGLECAYCIMIDRCKSERNERK
jgi:hypothetical protein